MSPHSPSHYIWRFRYLGPLARFLELACSQRTPGSSGSFEHLGSPDRHGRPHLHGQAWHFSSEKFLSGTANITEILSTSCTPSTWGHSLTVANRCWKLLHPATSPPQGTILRTPSRPLVYLVPMATLDWFPGIFGTRDARALLLTLLSLIHI